MLSSNPHPDRPSDSDLTTIAAFAAFMETTGRNFTVRTYQRWVRQAGLRMWTDYADSKRQLVSRTDMLRLHCRHQKP